VQDERGGDGGDTFAAAGEAQPVRGRSGQANRRAAERSGQNLFRFVPAGGNPGTVPDDLNGNVAHGAARGGQQPGGFGQQRGTTGTLPARPGRAELGTKISEAGRRQQRITRGMGGDIKVASRRGGGTTFTLTVTLASANGMHTGATDEGLAALAIPPLRVLGVEDNPFGRVVLNTILGELGHQAEFIGRGEAAAERIAQGGFDAVLMDMVLPGIDGIEAISRIRALGPPHGRIAIIGVSGRGDDEAASLAAGADAFLLKPVSPRALATALLEALRREAAAT